MEAILNAFYGMVERGPLGLWAFIAACGFALWLWVKAELFKQGPAP